MTKIRCYIYNSELKKQHLIDGLKDVQAWFYEHTTKSILGYIHSDLWGFVNPKSFGGVRYFLSLVDDYSR